MNRKKSKLNVEGLECRQMMAGDVHAVLSGGDLIITEEAGQIGQDNGVFISQSNGKIRVSGDFTPSGSGGMSKVNGQDSQEFTVTGNLIVRLGAGSDGISFDRQTRPTFDNVDINVGAPLQTITRTSGTPTASTFTLLQPDNDDVEIEGLRTRGSVKISTGRGNDNVFMSRFSIGSAPNGHGGDLNINTGAGADTVFMQTATGDSISNVFGKINIQTFASSTESDVDDVSMQTILALGDVTVATGGGVDNLFMRSVTSGKKIDFNMGAGDDTATLRTLQTVDGLFARMGEGTDTLFVDTVLGNATLMGEGGVDTLTHTGLKGKVNSLTGWETINGRKVLTSVFGTPVATAQRI